MKPPTHPSPALWPASSWRTQAAILFTLQVAELVLNSLRADDVVGFDGIAGWLAYKGDELLRQLPRVVAGVLALQALERLPAQEPYRSGVALLLMLAAAWIGSAASAYGLPYDPVAVRFGASASTVVWFWFVLWNNMMINLLALVAIDRLRARQQAIQRLAAAQEQGRVVRQQLANAQLLAIQARVDPQLLFDTLAAVRRLYDRDPERAEQLLDELTDFLRSALPRLRSARSTLEIEFELARAYVRLLRSASATPVDLRLELLPAHAPLAFPAGVLLPLLAAKAADARTISLDARVDGERLRVAVHDSVAPAAATLQRLRASLLGLYGAAASLRSEACGRGALTALEVPLERA